ncbi:MAG: 30S ribosomal protein S6 [Anaerolineales bacterium]|nr:30S ribosomal protein S6 [Anaerolineales bacterium]
MLDYEMVLVISPEIEVAEEDSHPTVDKVAKLITAKGGTVTDINRWGKRKLAYPIKSFIEGEYYLTQFKMDPNMTHELEANLKLTEEILRHLLIRLGS